MIKTEMLNHFIMNTLFKNVNVPCPIPISCLYFFQKLK